MEMEKPAATSTSSENASLSTTAPQLSSVEDLERKLKLIGTAPSSSSSSKPATDLLAAAPAASASTSAPTPAPAPTMSGKTALLARIQAAKAKSQKAQSGTASATPGSNLKPPPPMAAAPSVDLLSGFDAPGQINDPPPAYETNFLGTGSSATTATALPPPPETDQAPSFDPMQFAPPPPLNTSNTSSFMAPPPPSPPAVASSPFMPEATAPAFEDLHPPMMMESNNLLDMPAALPPPAMAPPSDNGGIDEDILAALDPAERDAILEEQRKIMAQIEDAKVNDEKSSAAARAMAFDQRSSSAVAKVAGQYDTGSGSGSSSRKKSSSSSSTSRSKTKTASSSSGVVDLGHGEMAPLHGQDKTKTAIQNGEALIVQCLNCQNWMQVTQDATLMFCPTCQVVSPVLADEAATKEDLEHAAMVAADAQLAEKLQAEEYGAAEAARQKAAAAKTKRAAKLEKETAMEQSWYDWFTGTASTTGSGASDAKSASSPPPARGSAELPSRSRGLVAASTGEESYGQSYEESARLVGSNGGGARMAESKGMFACVADAVGTAVYAMNQDEEGNVHGVDSSGLLAMPNVSRQRE